MALICLPLQLKLANKLHLNKPILAVFLLVLSTSFSYWAMGGLEGPLVAFVLLWLVVATMALIEKKTLIAYLHFSVATALALMSRPEMPVVIVLAGLVFFLLQWWSGEAWLKGRKLYYVILSIIALVIALLAWRYSYFGQLFPQPVYAKSGGSIEDSIRKIGFGFVYFAYAMQISIIFYTTVLLIVVYKILRSKQATSLLTLLVSFASALLAFVIMSGGDWMTGGRFFVPVIPFLILIALWYLQNYKSFPYVVSGLVLMCALELGFVSHFYSTGMAIQHFKKFDESLVQPIDWEGYSWTEKMNYIHIDNIVLINHL